MRRHAVAVAVLAVLVVLGGVGTALAKKAKDDGRKAGGLTIDYKDRSGRLAFVGDWATVADHTYTSAHTGSGKRKGTLTCTPGLASGTYEVAATFHASVNRGDKARYLVDGKLAKVVDQREKSNDGAYPTVVLGVFTLTPESKVVLQAQDGKSYSFIAFRFRKSDGTPVSTVPGAGSGSGATGADAGDGSGDTLTATADGELVIKPLLSTRSPALFRVILDGTVIFRWQRENDVDGSLAEFQGKPDPASMVEVKPGDFSPAAGLCYRCPIKAGQKVVVVKRGDLEPGAQLVVEGPFAAAAGGLDDVLR